MWPKCPFPAERSRRVAAVERRCRAVKGAPGDQRREPQAYCPRRRHAGKGAAQRSHLHRVPARQGLPPRGEGNGSFAEFRKSTSVAHETAGQGKRTVLENGGHPVATC